MKRRSLLLSFLVIVSAGLAIAQAPQTNVNAPIAITNVHIYPVSSAPINSGTLVISQGKIASVGPTGAVPPGAEVIDGSGLFAYPGFFDANTELGISEIPLGARGTVDVQEIGDFNPAAVSGTSVNPSSDLIGVTRVNGITNALTSMRGGLVSGQASVIDLAGWTTDDMNVRRQAALWINFPQHHGVDLEERFRRLISGEEPPSTEEREREYRRRVNTLRDYFARAREYAGSAAARQTHSVELGSMVPYITGRAPVLFAVNRAEDIRAAIDFGEAEKLRYAIVGGHDAWQALDALKAHRVPVIFGSVASLPSSENDPYDAPYSTPARLREAGIPFAIATGSGVDSRNLAYQTALAIAYGLPEADALRAITLAPAQILGIDNELGSLDPGKRANIVVTSGDPFDVRTQIRYVFIDGRRISLESKQTREYELYRQRQ